MHIIKYKSLNTITIIIIKLYVYTIRLFDAIFFKNQRIGVGVNLDRTTKVSHEAQPTSSQVDNVVRRASSYVEDVG